MSLPQTKTISVVIIEDFKLTRVGLRCALNANPDIEVVGECEDAFEGLETIKKTNPDVVLMDLGLPKMNGIEATIKVKEFNPKIKVIALTSHDREEEVLAALSSGATAYCLKDIDPTKLADVVRDVAKGVCWLDPEVAQMALNSFPKVESTRILSNSMSQEGRVPLTEREYEVLKHLVMGKSNTEIAKELIVSVHTAKAHVCSILQKMCVSDRVQAAVKAVKEGLV
ncbi:MAG: DNA-binding response regulator [Candidatus Melainabacteria bacterium]|jgi:DNA-binding NarL/FixJ family response regulator|nr:MAG: DNA-binding response regulator [Candidatus Melainabacteria bacterium]RAI10425.1 MAG: DNA-binding response regulator [Candidatus Melainabacteria bacterium]